MDSDREAEIAEEATRAATEAVMGRLYDAVTDAELTVLDALMYRTGLLWHCRVCGANNAETDEMCQQCTAPRPTGETRTG